MGIKVIGENQKLWINNHVRKDGGVWSTYNIGVSKKNQEGGYINAYVRAKFAKELFIPENIENGEVINFEGFMTCEVYKDRNGLEVKAPLIFITEASFPNSKEKSELYDPAKDTELEPLDDYTFCEMDIPF